MKKKITRTVEISFLCLLMYADGFAMKPLLPIEKSRDDKPTNIPFQKTDTPVPYKRMDPQNFPQVDLPLDESQYRTIRHIIQATKDKMNTLEKTLNDVLGNERSKQAKLQIENQDKEKELGQLKEYISTLFDQQKSLRNEDISQKNLISELQLEKKHMTEQVCILQRENQTMRDSLEKQQEHVQRFQTQCDSLEEENGSQKKAIELLRNENETMRSALKNLENSNMKLQTERDRLKKENGSLIKEKEIQQNQHDSQIEEFVAERISLLNGIDKLTQQVNDVKQENAKTLESSRKELTENAKKDSAKLAEQYNISLQRQNQEKIEKIDELKKQLEKRDEQLQQSKANEITPQQKKLLEALRSTYNSVHMAD